MLKFIWLTVNISLILIIFIRVPNNNGLYNFTEKSNLLGSPNSAEKTLNALTFGLILTYFALAVRSNLPM